MDRLDAERGWFLLIEQGAVAGALDECDAGLHRVAHQRVERVDERALDQTVDQQPVRLRIDVWNAAVVALEMKSVRRNHAVEQVMRRARGAGAGRPGHAREDPRNLAGISRRLSVRHKGRAGRFHPRLDRQRLRREYIVRQCGASDRRRRTASQKETAVKKSVSGRLFRLAWHRPLILTHRLLRIGKR